MVAKSSLRAVFGSVLSRPKRAFQSRVGLLAACACLLLVGGAPGPASQPADAVVSSQTLSCGLVASILMGSVEKGPELGAGRGPFSRRLEMQVADADGMRHVIAGVSLADSEDGHTPPVQVLAFQEGRDELVVAAGIGGGLYLWRVNWRSKVVLSNLMLLSGWQKIARFEFVDAQTTKVELGQRADNGWSAKVWDQRAPGRSPALFELQPDGWVLLAGHDGR